MRASRPLENAGVKRHLFETDSKRLFQNATIKNHGTIKAAGRHGLRQSAAASAPLPQNILQRQRTTITYCCTMKFSFRAIVLVLVALLVTINVFSGFRYDQYRSLEAHTDTIQLTTSLASSMPSDSVVSNDSNDDDDKNLKNVTIGPLRPVGPTLDPTANSIRKNSDDQAGTENNISAPIAGGVFFCLLIFCIIGVAALCRWREKRQSLQTITPV